MFNKVLKKYLNFAKIIIKETGNFQNIKINLRLNGLKVCYIKTEINSR